MQVGDEIELTEIPLLLKRKSSQRHERITTLQSKLVKGEDGKIYVSIKPKLERRIVDIQELVKEKQQDENHTLSSKKSIVQNLKDSTGYDD